MTIQNEDSVILALRTALEGSPSDRVLRLHLCSVLLKADRYEEALQNFGVILANEPANLEALQGAEEAARKLGKTEQADGYQRILSALGGAPASSNAEPAEIEALDSQGRAASESKKPKLTLINASDRFARDSDHDDTEKTITLSDVGGLEEVKQRINRMFLGPLRNPEIRKAFSKSLRGGVLLYGPPGCGKTYLARAIAGELKAHFYNVGIQDVLDMWFGESERKLHELFETARRNSPSVLFFDEIDALGHKRTQLKGHAGRTLVNTLLSELDGVQTENSSLFVLAATNHPWDVDAGLKRPGRFDRLLLVLPPDQPAREAILKMHLRKNVEDSIDVSAIAAKTDGFSGADLSHLCSSAIDLVMEESIDAGTVKKLSLDHLKKALKELKPSVRSWFETARNYAMFSNEGGMYDDLLEYIRKRNY